MPSDGFSAATLEPGLIREAPRPASGPKAPELGPIEGVSGNAATPMSGLRRGTNELG